MGSFSIWHWLVVLAIVALVFGTKKLRNVGGDLGAAVKSFKKGLADDEDDKPSKLEEERRESTADEREDSKSRND